MSIYIIVSLVVLLFIYILVIYNSFVRLNNKLNKTFSTMDVYLKKRWDLIPNIVKVVKGYAEYEKDTLDEIVEARNSSYDYMSINNKIEKNERISEGINKIMAIAEAYPDLKANENFLDLSRQLVSIENEIAESRNNYNNVVRKFNNKVEMFPSSIFAKLFGYSKKEMFLANDKERDNIKISL